MASAVTEAAECKLCISGTRRYPCVRKIWPNMVQNENIKSGQAKSGVKSGQEKGCAQLDKEMNDLTGNEPPEL